MHDYIDPDVRFKKNKKHTKAGGHGVFSSVSFA